MPRSLLPPTLLLLIALGACGQEPAATSAQPPSHSEAVAHESELLKLTLTPQAERRLGLRTIRVGDGEAAARRETSGEIVAPNAAGGVPTGSASNIAQLGAQQAAADGEIARTRALVRVARIARDRAAALVREEAGSVRARDEAAAALATAEAQHDTALAQRRLLGPGVASLGHQAMLWVRVPVFGTDMAQVVRAGAAEVRPLGEGGAPRAARPVPAPPSANATAGTVDLYYALGNADRGYRIGQRVAVALPIAGGAQRGLSVPGSAIVRDIHGGEWVYQRTAPHTYLRRRIEVAASAGADAILSRGLARGDEIVAVGAMELFGTEFGVAH